MTSRRSRILRLLLIGVLVVAVLALVGAIAVLVPILTHQSAGGSGQRVPDEFVSQTTAKGADGRTRELAVETSDGEPAELGALRPGESLTVRGTGFDAGIGIYVAICAIPDRPDEKPGPCLGGIPEGAEEGHAEQAALSSVWITDDWAWRAFATKGYDDAQSGSFTAELTVPAAESEGLDCRATRCAIATRADHTAGSDRVQDMLLPVAFDEAAG
ncbi:hypothetical protein [Leucobacter tenebrionis]|uniref:hypothetical protein n=1 Tax=Leucobacter tenebrionis TaxID=2873270 RepID=UPI001CA6A182|nr:hypothetical protein [Leucobacter tenebrionis]QZY51378.1 hypothetical protein KVY00_12455 [Leucobacter tenebrionis]